MTGYDVGVVVVGETPYAEGVGDIGNGRTDLSLSAADQAAIDTRVRRDEVRRCSSSPAGRCIVGDQLGEVGRARRLVAAGHRGRGRRRHAVRRQAVHRPAADDLGQGRWRQLPINVGDATYDPQYPYGWGLRTDSAKARITTVRDSLAAQHTIAARIGAQSLTALLASGHWNPDGSVNPLAAFIVLGLASPAVIGTSPSAESNANLLVSVARDIAQDAVVANGAGAMPRTAALTADAEHDLLVGDPTRALSELAQAWNAAQSR